MIKTTDVVRKTYSGEIANHSHPSLKHLGMMERNDKGHEIRKYYIEQEKIARDALNGIQLEIGKLSILAEQWTETLSNAGRILSVGGKQVKPKILKKLDELIKKTQHKLDFDDN
jgi:hypothetical protein